MADKIQVTFLGTGSAIPTAKRNHPSVLLSYKDQTFLFDCGEGTQRQFRKARMNPMKVQKIFITHWHGDHTLGLMGLLQTLSMNGYNQTLEIHGPKGTKKMINEIQKLFLHSYNQQYRITAIEHTKGTVIDTSEIKITSYPLYHTVPAIGYLFEVKPKRRIDKQKLKKLKIAGSPLLQKLTQGKNITIDGKKVKATDVTYVEDAKRVAYALDTSYHASIAKHVSDADLLIIESTFTTADLAMAKEKKHLTAGQAATIAKEAGVKRLALIHPSQRYDADTSVMMHDAKKVFKKTILFPKDTEKISI